ncbi:hypothetical protein [Algisphaera agarilytica]|uniref:REP element-mobilizing transposase RayT n=1 Tax=Algisphaera agarilytica TaxID=1385975 RepID=A0A7X0H9C9_9BACT|nr:hypothetical protein [Algisphaera agarilytica]MBB6430240.1 REP element-mobilizing transposase RayT [Algisphaera agarilytica]
MPAWHDWWHLCLHTHGTWLHGDPRGFRNRNHRVHSSGDYKHPPPQGEHAGLHRYHQERSGDAVVIPPSLRVQVGEGLLRKINKIDLSTLAIAVGTTHTHVLCKVPGEYQAAKAIQSTLKQAGSRAVSEQMSGRIWAAGGKPIEIKNRGHQVAVLGYIIQHQREGAWVWEFKNGVVHDPSV